MSFKDLENMGWRDFVENERKGTSLWLFMHIPKTAGSSLSQAMRRFVSPYKNICVDYSDETIPHREKISISTDRFIDSYQENQYRSASGHVTYDLVERIMASVPSTKVVTFLRDPVERVISDYRYQRTPQHPPYAQFAEEFPTLESYIDSPVSHNKMAHFVAGQGARIESIDFRERLDNDFSFVGLLEMYPLSYNVLFNLFGVEGQFPKIHARKTPDTPETKVDINDSIISMIKARNEVDMEMYNHVRTRLMSIRDDWRKYLRTELPRQSREENQDRPLV